MLYANNKLDEKIFAGPNKEGYCPLCNEDLIPKCGEIKIWHWSHKCKNECDTWSEGESEWHLFWKSLVDKKYCEVKIGNHFADIKIPNGLVIELQNSSISSIEIKEREKFYKNMIWIVNANKFIENIDFRKKENYYTFRWKWPRISQTFMKRLFWDFNKPNNKLMFNKIFEVKKLYPSIPCGGYGNINNRSNIINKYLLK